MTHDLLIRNGRVIDPETQFDTVCDVAVAEGVIAAVGTKRRLPHLNVMGGCCGTDHRHVEQIAMVCANL